MFFHLGNLKDFHGKGIDDIFEENASFDTYKINTYSSKTVRNRRFYIIGSPRDTDTVNEVLFSPINWPKDIVSHSELYCAKNHLELPALEILSFIFANTEIRWRLWYNIAHTVEKDQISIILMQVHNAKNHLRRGINESIRRIKEIYNRQVLIQDVETFIKNR